MACNSHTPVYQAASTVWEDNLGFNHRSDFIAWGATYNHVAHTRHPQAVVKLRQFGLRAAEKKPCGHHNCKFPRNVDIYCLVYQLRLLGSDIGRDKKKTNNLIRFLAFDFMQ